jgi:V8-like Glu-specific endopeptidase
MLLAVMVGVVACLSAVHAASPTADPLPTVVAKSSQRLLKVFGTDDRLVVGDTTQFPWSTIGMVQATWNLASGETLLSKGTGTLVGNSLVLTAGHCVYDQTEGWAHQIVFIPGANDGQEPFGRASSVRTISQSGWVESDDNRYDLALIVLDKPLGVQAGYMRIGAEPDSFFVDRNLNTAGYPAETKPGNVMYHTSGASMDVQNGLIRDTLDSEPGQSGSPIWYYQADTQSRDLVGVLTGSQQLNTNGQITDAYNVAVKIDGTFAQWISDTLAKYDTVKPDAAVTVSDSLTPAPVCGNGASGAIVATAILLQGVKLATGPRRERRKHIRMKE